MINAKEVEIDVRSPTDMVRYYSYSVNGISDDSVNYQNYSAVEKNELSISHNGRLVHCQSGICIRNKQIAQDYLDKNIKKWRKQWGSEVEVEVTTWTTNDRKSFFQVIEHTDTVLRRLGR